MPDTDDRPTGSPPPLLPGVLRMAVSYELLPVTATNVFHFVCHESGGLGSSDVSGMVTDLAGYWLNDVWKHYASVSATSTTVEATYALIEGQPNVKRVHIADAVAGMASGDYELGQTAWLINWDTGDARRGGKPRTYFFGIPDSIRTDVGHVDPAAISGLNADLVTFLGHVQGHVHGNLVCDNLVEYSTVNSGAYRAAGQAYTISAGSANAVYGTQRRRVDRLRG